ncbi:MAG: type II toxin-antitoxin system VapC family toxin [Candidatus Omnitrophota bacterium]|nr:type II toxin-antitoxin system VapC family toxin [Candidatus Omnitrophota bacterium]
MTAYLDTSALVKLYVDEPGAADTRRLVTHATHVATSRLSYVEARAAFARRYREGALSKHRYGEMVRVLDHEWETYVRLEVAEPIIKLAGELTERRALRAYDAVHLASALAMRQETRVEFVAADERLVAAALSEGLVTHRILV